MSITLAKSELDWWRADTSNYRELMRAESTHLIAKPHGKREAIIEDVALSLENGVVKATLENGRGYLLFPAYQITANTEVMNRFWFEDEHGWDLQKNERIRSIYDALRQGQTWIGMTTVMIHGRAQRLADETIDEIDMAVPIGNGQAIACNHQRAFIIERPEREQGVINVLAANYHKY